jgi:hypothetical protein
VKLTKGTLKIIFVSHPSLAENSNRVRAGVKNPRLVPCWNVFEYDQTEGTWEYHAASTFKSIRLTPRVNYTGERPYPWMPTTRPGFPRESLAGTHAWLETTDEIDITTTEESNG